MTIAIYIASVLGAVGVYLMMPRRQKSPRVVGALLGLAALAGLFGFWLQNLDAASKPSYYYHVFTAIAAAAGVLVITHPRPVYSAIYFVLTVLSVAGLLVLLEAEFMAFAMVLIYGGAILVTYMFVIMLATLPASANQPETGSAYDREARQPIMAVGMGFVLLAALCAAMFSGEAPKRQGGADNLAVAQRMPGKLDDSKRSVLSKMSVELRTRGLIEADESVFGIDAAAGMADVRRGIGVEPRRIALDDDVLDRFVTNIDKVGLNLFEAHTLGIELAGVILLLSMVGAIVIARQRVGTEGATT